MTNKIFPFLAAAAMMLLTACYHDQHEEMPSEYGDQPVGYLTAQLVWDDPADANSAIDDIRFTVSGTNGTTVAHNFTDTESAADWLQQLPVGDYDVLVTVDMDEAHGYLLENADTRSMTRADEAFHTALPDTRVSLAEPSSSPRQSWYAVTHATVKEDEITVAEFHLQRLLSELSVIVSNVPTGAAITASVERVAHDVLLTHRDGQGRYGVADREDYMTVSLGALAADPADAATLRHDDHTLMPTAGGQERCYLTLAVTTPEGTRLSYLADAPRMECGKVYVVELDYTKLRPYMLLSAFTINDWTEGWTISGEIINPDK
ncbi:MAG: FimB/Mfa2 family fimbrial subunit [Clostridia bacterium]|nr:FimB/Mfa2 family fimbrial subunit [Clostridia bacterium]